MNVLKTQNLDIEASRLHDSGIPRISSYIMLGARKYPRPNHGLLQPPHPLIRIYARDAGNKVQVPGGTEGVRHIFDASAGYAY